MVRASSTCPVYVDVLVEEIEERALSSAAFTPVESKEEARLLDRLVSVAW
jgi:hypothetical protein